MPEVTKAAPPALETGRWLGADGRPLPFNGDEQALEFLRSARVVESKRLSTGINRPLKVTLEKDGIRAHAIFRTVNVDRDRRLPWRRFRDSYIFEVAAYELSRLLGLDNVPPAVLRRLEGKNGSLQLWVEQAMTEAQRIRDGERVTRSVYLQKQVMHLFDYLIFNFDRNQGNILVDVAGKVWFVDHTRSFKTLPKPELPHRIQLCDRGLWHSLQALDPRLVRERLRPYLESAQITAVLKRRDEVKKQMESLISERGEERVLFEFVESSSV